MGIFDFLKGNKFNIEKDSSGKDKPTKKENIKKVKKDSNGNLETEYYVNIKGEKDGDYIVYYPNGNIKQKAHFINDVQNYESKVFNNKGKLIRLSKFIDGEFVGDIIEFYKSGENKIVKKLLSEKDCYQYNFYNKNGTLKAEIFLTEKYHDDSNEKLKVPAILLYDVQKLNNGINFLPFGKWSSYTENGDLDYEIDFEILKPKGSNIEFDCFACEIKKYEADKLISRENRSISKIESYFFSNEFNDLLKRSEEENSDFFEILDNILICEDFVIGILHKTFSEEKRKELKVVENPKNWIKGFTHLFHRPDEGQLSQYVTYYYESGEESMDHPLVSIPVTFTKSHVEIATFNEKDALKLINEIMIFNGGIDSFKNDIDNIYLDDMDFQYRNPIFRIYKSLPKLMDMPISDVITAEAEMVYIGIDLLPPKNITSSNVFSADSADRGVHYDSEHVNKLLPALNKPIFCNIDGGIADGRLFVLRDDESDVILSFNEEFDISLFKKVIAGFSNTNSILNLEGNIIQKIVDSHDLLSQKTDSSSVYNPKRFINKEDSTLCFSIGDKIMISYFKKGGFYHFRIDNKSDLKWDELEIQKEDKLDFYIANNDQKVLDSDFNTEASKLYEGFHAELNSFDEEQIAQQFEFPMKVDFPYWYDMVKKRADLTSEFDREKSLDQMIASYIFGHASEYGNKLIDDDFDFKVTFIKFRIIGFGEVYKLLQKLDKKINELLKTYEIKENPSAQKMEDELAHAKASLFGAIKYALAIGIEENIIKDWYSDFIYDKALIEVDNPMDLILQKHTGIKKDSTDEQKEQYELSDEERDPIPDWYTGPVYLHPEVIKNDKTNKEIELNPLERSIYQLIHSTEKVSQGMSENGGEILSNPFFINMLEPIEQGKSWFRENNLKAYEILFPNDESDENDVNINEQLLLDLIGEVLEGDEILYLKIKNEKDLKKQEKLIRSAMKDSPDNLGLLNTLAYNQYNQKKYTLGVSFCEMAIKKDPEKAAYYDTAGLGYFYLEDYHKALEFLNKSIEIEPEGKSVAEHYYNRGRIFIKLNLLTEARKDFEKALECDENYEDARKALVQVKD